MLQCNVDSVFALKPPYGVAKKTWQSFGNTLSGFLQSITPEQRAFSEVVYDSSIVSEIEKYVKKQTRWRDIVLFGVGGSALGASALQQALTPLVKPVKEKNKPRLHIIDNIDPVLIKDLLAGIVLKNTLFIVITKSGATPETMSQYAFIAALLKKKKLALSRHCVFVTDPEKGALRQITQTEKISTFTIPPSVGGRFSVLTPVGLLPAALIGLPIKQVVKGAQTMDKMCRSEKFSENIAFQLAVIQYILYTQGKTIHVLMPYSQQLIKFADWYRQLTAESLGKEKNLAGDVVHAGFTPVAALGATDQHSQTQLYCNGPHDKFFLFIGIENCPNFSVPRNEFKRFPDLGYLSGVSFQQLFTAERESTVESYTEARRPNVTITIPTVDAYHLGQLFMLFEWTTVFLGGLMKVNTFDQPGVERAKQLTKKKLIRTKNNRV